MSTVSRTTRKKSWRERQETATLMAEMAERRARIAQRLTDLRDQLGLTQEEAANRMDITLRQWQRWESGESEPYKRNLAKLSEEFEVPVSDFFEEHHAPGVSQLDRMEKLLEMLLERLPEPQASIEGAGSPAPRDGALDAAGAAAEQIAIDGPQGTPREGDESGGAKRASGR